MKKKNFKSKNFNYTEIQVHAGRFHTDDCLTVAMAKYIKPDIKIIRSDIIEDRPQRIVADIGYGPYDHHQVDAPRRPDGKKYAACGLFFRDFWADIFPDRKSANYFRRTYIEPIEDNDNGVSKNPLNMFVNSFSEEDSKLNEQAFMEVVNLFVALLNREVTKAKENLKNERKLKNILAGTEGNLVILDHNYNWKGTLFNCGKKYVIYPSDRGGYNLQLIPTAACRKPLLPEAWLHEKPKGCKFLHSERYLAAFGTIEEAIMAVNE